MLLVLIHGCADDGVLLAALVEWLHVSDGCAHGEGPFVLEEEGQINFYAGYFVKSNTDSAHIGFTHVVVSFLEGLTNDTEERLAFHRYSDIACDVFSVSVDKASRSVQWVDPKANVFFINFII